MSGVILKMINSRKIYYISALQIRELTVKFKPYFDLSYDFELISNSIEKRKNGKYIID